MLLLAMLAISSILVAWTYRASNKWHREENVLGMVFVCTLVVGLFGLLVAPGLFEHYSTESSQSLKPFANGDYIRFEVRDDGPIGEYRGRFGQVLETPTIGGDNDDSAEWNFYHTIGKPRIETRCAHTDPWVLPFGWDFAIGLNGCDRNIYLPWRVTAK